MIHYHGTPLSPRSELLKMAGKNFCVSFADPRDADWCLTHAQSVMWDNGAYTAFTQGKSFDMAAYFKWLEGKLGHPHFAVIPDVIDGSVEQQRHLIRQWPFGSFGAPVWHIALPIEWLLELSQNWTRICFGSSGRYWEIGSDDWCRRVDEAFNALSKAGSIPWIHGLRMMHLAGDRWPFASTDSVNVARNFKSLKVCPERMARRLDAIQCPITWTPPAEQIGLFA